MELKRLKTYIIIFNVLMAIFLFLSSQYVLYAIEQRGEVVEQIGLIIDTNYVGPQELTHTYVRADLLNYPLIAFILTLLGNAIFVILLRRESKTELRSKNSF